MIKLKLTSWKEIKMLIEHLINNKSNKVDIHSNKLYLPH